MSKIKFYRLKSKKTTFSKGKEQFQIKHQITEASGTWTSFDRSCKVHPSKLTTENAVVSKIFKIPNITSKKKIVL
jgi:hypothetical protein